jgi:hypothetical protein
MESLNSHRPLRGHRICSTLLNYLQVSIKTEHLLWCKLLAFPLIIERVRRT